MKLLTINQNHQSNEMRIWRRLTQAGVIAFAVFAFSACGSNAPPATPTTTQKSEPAKPALPAAFTASCSKCHGATGEGANNGKGKKGPSLAGLTTRAEEPRTVADIIGIINNPTEYGLDDDMPSFAKELSDNEKKELAVWIATLP